MSATRPRLLRASDDAVWAYIRSLERRIAALEAGSDPIFMPFSQPGAVTVTNNCTPWVAHTAGMIRSLRAGLHIVGSSDTVIDLTVNAVVKHTITIAASSYLQEDLNLDIPVATGDSVKIAVTSAGTGATELSVLPSGRATG